MRPVQEDHSARGAAQKRAGHTAPSLASRARQRDGLLPVEELIRREERTRAGLCKRGSLERIHRLADVPTLGQAHSLTHVALGAVLQEHF